MYLWVPGQGSPKRSLLTSIAQVSCPLHLWSGHLATLVTGIFFYSHGYLYIYLLVPIFFSPCFGYLGFWLLSVFFLFIYSSLLQFYLFSPFYGTSFWLIVFLFIYYYLLLFWFLFWNLSVWLFVFWFIYSYSLVFPLRYKSLWWHFFLYEFIFTQFHFNLLPVTLFFFINMCFYICFVLQGQLNSITNLSWPFFPSRHLGLSLLVILVNMFYISY